MSKLTRRRGFAVLAVLGVLAIAGAAIAYWTTSGAGSGTGTVGTSNGTVTLTGSFPASSLFPGGSVPVTFTAQTSSTSNLYVGTVTATNIATSDPGCLPADFSLPPTVENTAVPAGPAITLPNTGTLSMANTAANQDACKGATITLTLSSN